MKEQHLKEIFGCFGEIKKVDIVWDKRINVPCDYAFIEFSSSTDSERALNCMNGVSSYCLLISSSFSLFFKGLLF